MSEAYLQDRAAMLTWKIRYDLGELDDDDSPHEGVKPYNEDWDTNAVQGNWDFVDLGTRLPGGAPLTLSIDGYGLSVSDHQIVFGTGADETINHTRQQAFDRLDMLKRKAMEAKSNRNIKE